MATGGPGAALGGLVGAGFLCGFGDGRLGTHSQRLGMLVPGGHLVWLRAGDGAGTTVVVVICVTSSAECLAGRCRAAAAPAGKTAANRPANASPHDARPGHDFTRRHSPSTARQHRDCQVESHACTSASTERRASSKPRRRRTVTETPPGVNPAWKGFTTETRVPDVLIKTVTKLRTEGTATTQSRRRSQRGCECRKDGKTNLRSPSL